MHVYVAPLTLKLCSGFFIADPLTNRLVMTNINRMIASLNPATGATLWTYTVPGIYGAYYFHGSGHMADSRYWASYADSPYTTFVMVRVADVQGLMHVLMTQSLSALRLCLCSINTCRT